MLLYRMNFKENKTLGLTAHFQSKVYKIQTIYKEHRSTN